MENLHAAVWARGRLERKQTCRKDVMMVLWDKKLNMVQKHAFVATKPTPHWLLLTEAQLSGLEN